MENRKFISYADQELTREEVIQHALQYEIVNMAELIGANEDHFPFIVDDGDVLSICFWNLFSGITLELYEDPVLMYAVQKYLKDNAYPVFKSFKEAKAYSIKRDWPRDISRD